MSWIKKIQSNCDKALIDMKFEDKIPFGFYDHLKQAFSKNKAIQKFEFGTTSIGYSSDFENHIICELSVGGLNGCLYICVHKDFIAKICRTHISEDYAADFELLNAFTKFLVLEAIFSASKTSFLSKHPLTLNNVKTAELEDYQLKDSYQIMIPCTFSQINIPIILILDNKLKQSWSKYWISSEFAVQTRNSMLSEQKLLIFVEAASINITKSQLSSIETGDWINLSQSGFDIDTGTANVSLCTSGETICTGTFDGETVYVKSIL